MQQVRKELRFIKRSDGAREKLPGQIEINIILKSFIPFINGAAHRLPLFFSAEQSACSSLSNADCMALVQFSVPATASLFRIA
jgi:hypothetical protein